MVSRFVEPSVNRISTSCDTRTFNTIRTLQLVLFSALMLCGVVLLSVPGAAQSTGPTYSELAMRFGGTNAGARLPRIDSTFPGALKYQAGQRRSRTALYNF